ncbi:MAG: DUF4235 domain-containing protein [Propionibacteriales bacterium]|nr:DUF4235 domain-containing protein [Propionibacteriales bacterium]
MAKSSVASKDKEKGKKTWKMLGSGIAIAAGIATTKALDATWKTATGKEPPTSPESPDIGHREALVWAGVTGMAMGVAKMYATRRAANYWVRSFGTLPPGMRQGADMETKKKVG